MDFWRTVLVLVRRWYITVPACGLTLALAGAAYSVVPVRYQSVEVLVLTTPLSGGTQSTQPNHPNPVTNPLTNFDQSLALTASIVIQQLNSSVSARTLGVTAGDTTDYLVTNGSTNPELLQAGPFIFVQGNGASPGAAKDIADRVSALAVDVLARRQTELNAPESTHINIQVVVPAAPGRPLTGSPMRAAAAAGALSGLAGLVAVYGFESLMTHRRRRRAERASSQGHVEDLAAGALLGRSTRLEPSRRDPATHDGASAAHHRVNGCATATGTGAVALLESPDRDGAGPHDPSGTPDGT